MHGGVSGQHIESRLWIFNLTTNAWTYHDYNDTFALAGHSAVILDNVMYIIFGHSPLYGYLNRVHELHLGTLYLSKVFIQTIKINGFSVTVKIQKFEHPKHLL